MAKKRKSKPKDDDDAPVPFSDNISTSNDVDHDGDEYNGGEQDQRMHRDLDDESSSDDDSLVLEGVLIRNPDASDDDDECVSSEDDKDEDPEPVKKKVKKSNKSNLKTVISVHSGNDEKQNNSRKQTRKAAEPEIQMIQVEFLFCDMNEKFFHGMKTLLHRHSIHSPHSSQLADLIIENVSVGTVLTTDDPNSPAPVTKASKTKSSAAPLTEDEPNVFGFASVINLTTHHSAPCIQCLKTLCLEHCPSNYQAEMETVLSGKTKRPAGFFFQERMVNVPLEIAEDLHKQLVLDIDWAVDNAEGGEDERKSLDFGAFVRLAPCLASGDTGGMNNVIYKYFDDEIFASNAEFFYTFEAPKMFEGDEQVPLCSVIVMTKTGHRAAMKDLAKMIHGN